MTLVKCWAGSIAMLLALTSAVFAEASASFAVGPMGRLAAGPRIEVEPEKLFLATLGPPRLGAITRDAPAARPLASGKLTEAWLVAQPAPAGGAELECLAKAIYFEARGESVRGQAAVAEVILNRVDNPEFPNTICRVVGQRGNGGCQFSYVCDGKKDRIREKAAWDLAQRIAAAMIAGAERTLTDGATHFHTPGVRPAWARRYERTVKIGYHVFYRQPIRTALN